jgi:hypothetical protein
MPAVTLAERKDLRFSFRRDLKARQQEQSMRTGGIMNGRQGSGDSEMKRKLGSVRCYEEYG